METKRKISQTISITVWREIYNAFLRVRGYSILAIMSFIAGWIFVYYPDGNIPIKWIVPFLLATTIIVITLVDCFINIYKDKDSKIPSVIRGQKPQGVNQSQIAQLLLTKSSNFGYEAIVTIYIKRNGFEIVIGFGFVESIQPGGVIQIIATKTQPEYNDLWEKITGNDSTILSTLIVRPTITRGYQFGN